MLTSVLQGLTTYAFVMLLLAMVPLHMLTLRLMVTMVAEFCSLVNFKLKVKMNKILIYGFQWG